MSKQKAILLLIPLLLINGCRDKNAKSYISDDFSVNCYPRNNISNFSNYDNMCSYLSNEFVPLYSQHIYVLYPRNITDQYHQYYMLFYDEIIDDLFINPAISEKFVIYDKTLGSYTKPSNRAGAYLRSIDFRVVFFPFMDDSINNFKIEYISKSMTKVTLEGAYKTLGYVYASFDSLNVKDSYIVNYIEENLILF